jgi:hypothetical protein
MVRNNIDPEIKKLTQELIFKGTNYNLDYLDKVYNDDLKFVRIDKENQIEVLTKQDNMNFFSYLKKSGAKPLNDSVQFHYADNDGKNGFIILSRTMKQQEREQEFLFNINWKRIKNNWQIIRETVIITN